MKSIFAVFLLVQPHLGGKHFLVEVADNPDTGNGEVSGDGNDYGGHHGEPKEENDYGLSKSERCKGLKELCKGRPTCLEAIKCNEKTGGYESEQTGAYESEKTGAYESEKTGAYESEQTGAYEAGKGQKQHKELEPAEFEHKKSNDGPYK